MGLFMWVVTVLACAGAFGEAGADGVVAGTPSSSTVAPARSIRLGSNGAMRITEQVEEGDPAYDFDIMWGPSPGDPKPFEGVLILPEPGQDGPPTIELKRGYVYVAGRLMAQDPDGQERKDKNNAPWPVVVTQHLTAAADGTVLVVQVGATQDKVFRLDPWRSGEVCVVPRVIEGPDAPPPKRRLRGSSAQVVGVSKKGTIATEPRHLTRAEDRVMDLLRDTAIYWGIRKH